MVDKGKVFLTFGILLAVIVSFIALGKTGKVGPEGLAGKPGIAGAPGPAGPQGPQGVAGPAGAAGAAGPAGVQGPMGQPGPAGPRGERGDIGVAGAPGAGGQPPYTTPPPTGYLQSTTLLVPSGADDCYASRSANVFNNNGTLLGVGSASAGQQGFVSSLRFNFSSIPARSSILSASIQVLANASGNTGGFRSWVMAEAQTNPTQIGSMPDFFGRPRAVTRIDWSAMPAWSASNWYSSPDISPLLQEVVNAVWYYPGVVNIFWSDDDIRSTVGSWLNFYSFEGGYPAKLNVTWRSP